MNTNPVFDEPLLPSLFQFTDRADAKAAAKDRRALSELMLDPKRLEAILKAIGKRKKSAQKRTS